MSKKGSTKRQKSQAKRQRMRRKPVSYIAVPKRLWKRLKQLLPKRAKGQVGRPALSNRLVLDAIWFVLWKGCQWKAITREHFGVSGSTAHARFQQWQQDGIFAAMMTEMVRYYDKKRKIRWKWQAADGKNCPAPLGGEETGPNPTDRAKSGSKLHLLVDRPDAEQHLCLDRGYDYADIWELLELEHYHPHIKHRRRRGEPPVDDCPVPGETRYPARRWVVERTLSWLAKRRSVRTRWCKKADNWLALLQFACVDILFNMATAC